MAGAVMRTLGDSVVVLGRVAAVVEAVRTPPESATTGPRSPAKQRAPLGPCPCGRPGCGRAFQPRRTGGRPQEFCSSACRRRFDGEIRRAARARARRRATSRRRGPGYWASAIDMTTGRRVPVAIIPPDALARYAPGPERAEVLQGG